ncbi:S66 family peptidase [Halospeciosus flavus]|uniref:S66 peptidase family protein n=1 Tax=Halospeciosus flavus TaxID=3032283 RepID=A0ABD5Z4H8_9EURY|nr:S66 peptidase family protein [Halospeciosus flavus]
MTEFVTPPALEPGDEVAVVAPSSGGAHDFPHVLELALERLRGVFDLRPVVYPTARQGNDFLEVHPEARAADVHTAFRDPDISGVFATIGGSDQLRVLRHLDADTLREHPTRFYGMSDNSNLGLFLWRAGVVSYNGAQLLNELGVRGELPEYTERYARRAFFEDALGELEASERWTDEPTDWWPSGEVPDTPPDYEANPGWSWHGGEERATGRLWGGCLSVVDWHLASDRYLPDPARLDGAVLAVEIAEDLPRADDVAASMLCMGERGLLERFAAVLVGRVPGRSFLEQPPADERAAYRRRVREAVVEKVGRYNPDAPVVTGLDWGHTTPTAPLPLGSVVEVDPRERSVAFR